MKYEFMGIVKPFLPEDVRKKLIGDIEKIFTTQEGKITDRDLWGKRHLAYKIRGHEEGYYILLKIEIPKDKINKAEEELRQKNDLLRYMVVIED